ncbi:DnaB-like DNA helicase [Vibrio phage 1.076.O._10N.286.51.B7]|nr:DnaB-like DNA helicase [Vibrio phage 1.076.O._10N.286.51.B7]
MMEPKIPSHSISSEQHVLGCLLCGASVEEVAKVISSKDFYSRQHRIIFDAIKSVHQKGHVVELGMVDSELEFNETIEDAGGYIYIAELDKNTSSTANCMAYADTVRRHSVKRALVDVARQIQEEQDTDKAVKLIQQHVDLTKDSLSDNSGLSDIMQGDEGFDFEVSWLIKNYLPEKSLGMVYGPGGSYKSFHALDWAGCIATGKAWAGNKSKKGAVLYIAGEGQSGVGKRIKAWNIVNRETSDNLFRTKGAVNMTSKEAVEQVVSYCRLIKATHGVDVELIVLDTVNRCFGDGDENSTQDMTKFVAGCDLLMSEANVGIVCVHHSGKDVSKGARGSSVLRNAMDYEYSIARTPTLGYTLKCTKAKEFEEPNAQDYALRKVDIGVKNEDGEAKTSLARVGNGRDSTNIEVDEGVQKLIDWMQDNRCDMENGLNHKFVKDEIKSWFKDSPTEEAKRKAAERLLKKATDHGYISFRQSFYYLLETTGDNAEWGAEGF